MRFSIVIPCLNRREDLRTALSSCLAQTLGDFEVIVVDDASDETLGPVCAGFRDERIRFLRNTANEGVSASRNRGIAAARGEYVSFLDSDDVYLPNRLSVLDARITAMMPAPAIVFHRQHRIAANGKVIVSPARLPTAGERLDDYVLIEGNFVQTNSYVVERRLTERVRFDRDCPIYEDTKFLLECWLASPGYVACPEVLSNYHDLPAADRLSRRRAPDRLEPMLAFAQAACSSRAAGGFAAHVAAEIPFFEHPALVLRQLCLGYRAGVPTRRSLAYLARSVLGGERADRLARWIR